MLTSAEAPRPDQEATEPKWRQAERPSDGERDASKMLESHGGRNDTPPYNHPGTVVVACAWLAFYLIVAIHFFASMGK